MKALVVNPGTQHSFSLAAQLQLHGCLGRFWTGFAYVPDSILGSCLGRLPAGLRRRLANRVLYDIPAKKLRTQPLGELRAMRRLRKGHDDQTVMFERNAAFQKQIPRKEIASCDVVIGFDTASWLLAERAQALGRQFILVQTSLGYPRSFDRLFPIWRRQFPEWAEDFPPRFHQLCFAENVEQRQAIRIVVASSLVQRTLVENGVPAERIAINPFGINLDEFFPIQRPDLSRPLRFVFLGSVAAPKGVPLLLQAWRSLRRTNAELWLVGPLSDRRARLIAPLPGLRVIGKVPHRELPDLLHKCDVLVFPSYFEGFGMVLLEALAAGLPVIASDATAAPDLITDGVEGYIIPVGNAEALRDALQRFINSPGDLVRMSQAARRCAERYSWKAYGDRWMDVLQQVV